MVEFLLFCIATVGMTSIIVQGVIFQPFRQFIGDWAEKIHTMKAGNAAQRSDRTRRSLVEWFNELINCAQCTGFWCGLFCGLFLLSSDAFWITEGDGRQAVNRLVMWFCCGLGGSFLSSLGCNVIDWVFYRKMNALRLLERQDLMLEQHRASDLDNQE